MEAGKKARGCVWLSAGCATAIVLSLLVGVVVLRSTFGGHKIAHESMSPTLSPGDGVLTRPAKEIRRGDLVLYRPLQYRQHFLHRVVALPGESFSIRNDVVYINGLPLDERYVWIDNNGQRPWTVGDVAPSRVPVDHFILLGDNRDNANDSRYLGPIPRDRIRERVVYVISPKNIWSAGVSAG